MRNALIVSALFMLCVAPVAASNPGEPLDCSDWVFLEPGLSCSDFARPCAEELFCSGVGLLPMTLDNEGRQYRLRTTQIGLCGTAAVLNRAELVRWDGARSQVVAYIEDRCLGGNVNPADYDQIEVHDILFDEEQGRMVIRTKLVSKLELVRNH